MKEAQDSPAVLDCVIAGTVARVEYDGDGRSRTAKGRRSLRPFGV